MRQNGRRWLVRPLQTPRPQPLQGPVLDPKHDSVEDLMQRFKESFRTPNTTMDMTHFQHATHSSSTGRKRGPSHTRVLDPKHDSVEDLMQRFKESFRTPNTTMDMTHFQHATHSSSTGRKRGPSHTRAVSQRPAAITPPPHSGEGHCF
ncbi:unnamed protein product [Merluccius merluccius]